MLCCDSVCCSCWSRRNNLLLHKSLISLTWFFRLRNFLFFFSNSTCLSCKSCNRVLSECSLRSTNWSLSLLHWDCKVRLCKLCFSVCSICLIMCNICLKSWNLNLLIFKLLLRHRRKFRLMQTHSLVHLKLLFTMM